MNHGEARMLALAKLQGQSPMDLATGGWERINAATGKLTPEQQAQLELQQKAWSNRQQSEARSFFRCFNTPDGRIVLSALRRNTIDQPAFSVLYSMDGKVNEQNGWLREGGNEITRWIYEQIRLGGEG